MNGMLNFKKTVVKKYPDGLPFPMRFFNVHPVDSTMRPSDAMGRMLDVVLHVQFAFIPHIFIFYRTFEWFKDEFFIKCRTRSDDLQFQKAK